MNGNCEGERPTKKLKTAISQLQSSGISSLLVCGEVRSPHQTPEGLSHLPHKEVCSSDSTRPVGGANTLLRIDSIERVLCSQVLETPFGPVGRHDQDSSTPSEDGFSIRCSQSYFRTASQALPEGTLQDHQAPEVNSEASEDKVLHDLHVEQIVVTGTVSLQREASTTPELAAEPEASAGTSADAQEGPSSASKGQAGQRGPALFPIFRPLTQRKQLHLIRHGESEYNAALDKSWDDPVIFDAPLTERGRRQAILLRAELFKMKIPEGALWVSSPLTRAMQTLLLACPTAHLLGQAASSAACVQSRPPRVMVIKEAAEHLATSGDVGRPASVLRSSFPQLSEQLAGLPEQWWYQPGANYFDGADRKAFKRTEPKQKMQARVGAFRRWLHSRPEKVIVAFGHCTFWREFIGPRTRRGLANCEVHSMYL